MADLPLK